MWTTLTAAIIAGCMAFDRAARNGPPIKSRVVIAGLVLDAVVIAGALTVVGSGVYWRSRGVAFPQSPGDWLLVIIAATVVGFCITLALFFAIFITFGDDDWFPNYYLFVGAIAFVAWLRTHYIVIRRHADSVAWRGVFVVLMLSPFTISILFWPTLVALIACVLWAAWSDWRNRLERSWTHWTGAALAISLCVSPICVFGF